MILAQAAIPGIIINQRYCLNCSSFVSRVFSVVRLITPTLAADRRPTGSAAPHSISLPYHLENPIIAPVESSHRSRFERPFRRPIDRLRRSRSVLGHRLGRGRVVGPIAGLEDERSLRRRCGPQLDGLREIVVLPVALLVVADHPGLLQLREVMYGGLPVHADRLGELGDVSGFPRELPEDLYPRFAPQ